MEIIYKEWDSLNFGFKVGELFLDSQEYINENDFVKYKEEGYKLIYIHSNKKLNSKLFCDEKITYSKKRVLYNEYSDENIRSTNEHDLNDNLLALSIESGKYSRYNLDTLFPKNLFILLYHKWIENSINKTIASGVLLYEDKNISKNALGLITFRNNNSLSDIGIIATDCKFQGHGIGSKLISFYESSLPDKIDTINVVTQGVNTVARNFYEKNGFKIKNIEYIYHYWIK